MTKEALETADRHGCDHKMCTWCVPHKTENGFEAVIIPSWLR